MKCGKEEGSVFRAKAFISYCLVFNIKFRESLVEKGVLTGERRKFPAPAPSLPSLSPRPDKKGKTLYSYQNYYHQQFLFEVSRGTCMVFRHFSKRDNFYGFLLLSWMKLSFQIGIYFYSWQINIQRIADLFKKGD